MEQAAWGPPLWERIYRLIATLEASGHTKESSQLKESFEFGATSAHEIMGEVLRVLSSLDTTPLTMVIGSQATDLVGDIKAIINTNYGYTP